MKTKTPSELSLETAKKFLAAVKRDLARARAAVKHERQNLDAARASIKNWESKVNAERESAKAERVAKAEARKSAQIAKLESKLAKIREGKTSPVGVKKLKADRKSGTVTVIRPESAVA